MWLAKFCLVLWGCLHLIYIAVTADFKTVSIAQDMTTIFICPLIEVEAPLLHLRVTKRCTKQQKPGFCPHYLKYIHLADVTTQEDAIMNALNVRKLNVYVNSRNPLIGLGMRLPQISCTPRSSSMNRKVG